MKIIDKIKFLFKKRQKYSQNGLVLEKNGKVVKNVNIKHYINTNRKWPGRIIANNLSITNYDSFCLLYELEGFCNQRLVNIIVKKTLFGRTVFRAAVGQYLLNI